MMFHVKPEADIYSSALDKSQVELCLLTGDATITQKTGLKYPDTLKAVHLLPAMFVSTVAIAFVAFTAGLVMLPFINNNTCTSSNNIGW